MEEKEHEVKEKKSESHEEVKVDSKLVQILVDSSADLSLDGFQENDKKVLSLLNQDANENENQYTFNGIARRLGMHQQSLARSLHRLEEARLVKKTQSGYQIAKNLDLVLVKKSRLDLEQLSKRILNHAPFEQIMQLYIPTNIRVEDVVNRLLGKWFGTLRWIGIIEGDGGYILQWASSDRYNVNLKIVSRYAVIESNAVGDIAKSQSMINAHKILEQITRMLKDEHKNKTHYGNIAGYN